MLCCVATLCEYRGHLMVVHAGGFAESLQQRREQSFQDQHYCSPFSPPRLNAASLKGHLYGLVW